MKPKLLVALIILVIGGTIAVYFGFRTNKSKLPSSVPATPSVSTVESHTPIASAPVSSPSQSPLLTCQAAMITSTLGTSSSGAGHIDTNLNFTNTSSTTCILNGNPVVSLIDASGSQLGTPADKKGAEGASPVILEPRASAHTVIDFPNLENFPAGTCSAAAVSLKIFLPGDPNFAVVPISQHSCPGWSDQAISTGITD